MAHTHLYLINPETDCPNHFNMDVMAEFGFSKASNVADAAVVTVAAMAPADFDVEVTDEHISPANFDTEAEYVGITGKISQWGRMKALAAEFRRRGKVVIIGGSYASLSPDIVRPHCDILVRGEIENLSEKLFADLREGRWKNEYVGDKPDLSRSPIPKWSLYPNERATYGSLQTARGCPFECEFCDVIQYVGRKTRNKSVGQVLGELDEVYRHGYRQVFLSDDNFTAQRNRAKEVLTGLRDWNARGDHEEVQFFTQLSIDAARDPELVKLCADAGLSSCFIGIETPNEESLKEAKKRQNLRGSLLDGVQTFVREGIMPIGGMMVGFDHDGIDIFRRQYEFAMTTAVPIFSVSVLVAPDSTPLHARMTREGRLIEGEQIASASADTNIIPRLMTREQLSAGVRWLLRELYRPSAFGERLVRFIEQRTNEQHESRSGKGVWSKPRPLHLELLNIVSRLPSLGTEEAALWDRVTKALRKNRAASRQVWGTLFQFMQYRYVLGQRGWLEENGDQPAKMALTTGAAPL